MSVLFEWNDSYSVKVKKIDEEHKRLVGLLNELNEAMSVGKGKDVTEKIIRSLIDYTRMHFKTEEEYFARFGYPDEESHVEEHNEFIHQVSDFISGFREGRLGLSLEIMNFLLDWLKNHIKGSDMKYSGFLTEKGLS